jgi:hypothetical protein
MATCTAQIIVGGSGSGWGGDGGIGPTHVLYLVEGSRAGWVLEKVAHQSDPDASLQPISWIAGAPQRILADALVMIAAFLAAGQGRSASVVCGPASGWDFLPSRRSPQPGTAVPPKTRRIQEMRLRSEIRRSTPPRIHLGWVAGCLGSTGASATAADPVMQERLEALRASARENVCHESALSDGVIRQHVPRGLLPS